MATVMFNGLQWRLREGTYFEVSTNGVSWDPSGDTAYKIRALAPLLGFVEPGASAAAPPIVEGPVQAMEVLSGVSEQLGTLLQVLPIVGRSTDINLLVPRHVLVELQREIDNVIAAVEPE